MSMRPDDHRRKWNKDEYQRKALDRIQKIKKGDEDGLWCFMISLHVNNNKKHDFYFSTSWSSRAS